MLGSAYSATTVSNITDVTLENIEAWQQRPSKKRYSILYLDGTYLKLRRDDVANDVVFVVVGVTEDGYREILGFYVGGQESSLGWKQILQDLTNAVKKYYLACGSMVCPAMSRNERDLSKSRCPALCDP